jgi:hypothetical protein
MGEMRKIGEIREKFLPHLPHLHSSQKRPTTYDHTLRADPDSVSIRSFGRRA